jgi:hypothetical protein
MINARAQGTAVEAEFAARMARIRTRVVLKFADRFEQTEVALLQMIGDGSGAAVAVAFAYRWFHDISGIFPTIGFEETGRRARSCASILVSPFRAQRGLLPDELELLTNGLEFLRIAALNETHSTAPSQRSAP